MIDMLPERNFEAFPSIRPTSAGKHLLIVDDDPAMRSMLTEYLEGENFKVTAVADGDSMTRALRKLAARLHAVPPPGARGGAPRPGPRLPRRAHELVALLQN